MKKLLLSTILLGLFLLLAVECPIHGKSNPYFTGKTKTVDGIFLKQYRCHRGPHTFWIKG